MSDVSRLGARFHRARCILFLTFLVAATGVARSEEIDVDALMSPGEVREAFAARLSGLAAAPPAQPFVLAAESNAYGGLFGADVSHHVTDCDKCVCTIDWSKVADQGVRFVYMKATDGTGVVTNDDASFPIHWKELAKLHQNGRIYRGAFHWLSSRPNQTGVDQAKHFLSVVPMIDDQLPPVVDFEEDPVFRPPEYRDAHPDRCSNTSKTVHGQTMYVCDGWTEISQEERMTRLRDWLTSISKASPKKPIIYTRTNFWHDMLGAERKTLMAQYSAWIAQYPTVPVRWHDAHPSNAWKMPSPPEGAAYPGGTTGNKYNSRIFWQFTEAGRYAVPVTFCGGKPKPGSSMDMNWFPSNISDFRRQFQMGVGVTVEK